MFGMEKSEKNEGCKKGEGTTGARDAKGHEGGKATGGPLGNGDIKYGSDVV